MCQKIEKKNFELYQVFVAKCSNPPILYTIDVH